MRKLLATLGACACLGACRLPEPPRVGEPRDPGQDVSGAYADIEFDLWAPRCATAACHAGAPPAAFPQLDPGASWEALVSVPSEQQPALLLVAPGDPEGSYLVHKLRGTHASQGGSGQRMPIGDVALDDQELSGVEAWIRDGAQNE